MDQGFFVQVLFAGTSRVYDVRARNAADAICIALDLLECDMPGGLLDGLPGISIVSKPAAEAGYMMSVEHASITGLQGRALCAA
jgi:hypothetical protein